MPLPPLPADSPQMGNSCPPTCSAFAALRYKAMNIRQNAIERGFDEKERYCRGILDGLRAAEKAIGWQTMTTLPPRRLWVIGATANKGVMPMNLQDDGIWQLSNGQDCHEAVTHWMLFPAHPSSLNAHVEASADTNTQPTKPNV